MPALECCRAHLYSCVIERRLKDGDKSSGLRWLFPKDLTADSVTFPDIPAWSESSQIWLPLLGHQALHCMIIKGEGGVVVVGGVSGRSMFASLIYTGKTGFGGIHSCNTVKSLTLMRKNMFFSFKVRCV